MAPRISIVIPNWNGQDFLVRCIDATLLAADKLSRSWELIVIDDASTDGSDNTVEREFPQVRLIRNARNVGFGETMNLAARESQGEILVCLNNDVFPEPEMLSELVEPLTADRALFGVSGKTIDCRHGSPNHVNMAAVWKDGRLRLKHHDASELSSTMFLLGGACAMRRAEFMNLGGFCELYAPGYWEDYDVSYLALKSGWSNAYNPHAIAHHLGQSSMKRAYGDSIEITRFRNQLRFQALNLTDPPLLKAFLRHVPTAIARSNHPRLLSRLAALKEFVSGSSRLITERERRRKFITRSDSDIFSQFRDHGRNGS